MRILLRKRCYIALLVVLLFSCFNLQAQKNGAVTIQVQNASLREVFDAIEKQSTYRFAYQNELLDNRKDITMSKENVNVTVVLDIALKGRELTYKIMSPKSIVITKKAQRSENQPVKNVSGTVMDVSGEPVIGASVAVKGTTNGTITDVDGNFIISNVPADAIIDVSYIGYKRQDIALNGQTALKVILKEDTETLDEVVVIGYGTTSTQKIVSAVTAIKGEKLQDLPFANVASTMQGRVSGVVVQNQGGEPGGAPKISIRGGGDPLYVIDGVISPNSWDFNTLNPEDIESISILKDAASLAVYGSRAADGIVLVKTKEGRKGQRSIVYSFNAQYSQPTVLPKRIDAYTYADVQNQAAIADGYGEYYQFSKEEMEIIKNQSNPYVYPNTDWYALGLKDFAPEYRHSLSMTGNQKDVNYYLSLAAFDQGSLYTSNALNYSRYNLRSNVNTNFDKIGLKVALNINAAMEKRKYPSFSAYEIWDALEGKSPLDLAYNEDGTLSTVSLNPLMEMDKRSGYDKNDGMFLNAQLVADWALPWVKGLSVGSMLYYRVNSSHVKKLSARAPQYGMDGSLLEVPKPSLREEAYFGESYQFELSASYQRTFADVHSVDAKVVFTASENTGHNFWASRRDYLSNTVDQLFAGASTTMQNAGNSDEGGRMGLVGRLKYDFANRYYIEGSFRYDGSDNFAPGHRWGFFPSVALGWNITEEPFFKNFGLRHINLLKLRGSYGQMGTESGVNRFGYLSTYNMAENAICIGGNLLSGFNEGGLTSPELLSWFTRNSLNYGVDVALLDYRLKGSVDYFFYVTKGGLVNPADRYTTPLGTQLPQIKSKNEHRREGFELSLKWSDSIGDFQYEIGTNMTYYNNLSVVKQEEDLSTLKNPYKRSVHQTDYRDLMLIDNGLYQSVDQILGVPHRLASTETKLGDIVYQDLNGDGKIDNEDQIRYGMPEAPHFTYGIDFGFSYKGFSLSGLLYGTGKRHMEFGTSAKKGEAVHLRNEYQLDYWREDNPNATFPRESLSAGVNGGNNQEKSSFWYRNASFLRLRDLSLAYDFKYKVLKNVNWLSMCKVGLTGSNLFTISKVSKYFDPENNGTYPVQRVYSVGITVGF